MPGVLLIGTKTFFRIFINTFFISYGDVHIQRKITYILGDKDLCNKKEVINN